MYCRKYMFYVDPTSTKPFELGTIEFPFKMLHYPFVELWNSYIDENYNASVLIKHKVSTPLYSF